jgi:bla regulator protein blaR1
MIAWLAEALIASSVLMATVLLIRRPVANQFGPRIAYCLWLIPALRMVLPPLPESWLIRPITAAPEIAITTAPMAMASGVSSPSVDWLAVGLCIWAAGAALHFAVHLWAYRRFAARAIANGAFMHEEDPGAIKVYATPDVSGPLAMGLTRPSILVPADFTFRYDAEERAFALAHEVAHHRRGDLKTNLGALALLSLHWFNPLAHMAYRAFRTDQELACDATIMADADAESRYAYGRALVKSACENAPLAACALDRKQELKRRLKMMQPSHQTSLRAAIGGAGALMLLAGGMLITGTAGANREVAKTRPVQIAQAEIPAQPASPAQSAESPEDAALPATPVDAPADVIRAHAEAAAEHAEQAATEAEVRAGEVEATSENHEAARLAAEAAREAANEARNAAVEAAATADEDAQEAAREAEQDAREASREAQEAAREAERDAADAARESARVERRRISAASTPGQFQLIRSITVRGEDGVVRQSVYVTTHADLRAVMVRSLEQAVQQIKAEPSLPDDERARVLAMIEAKLASLRNRQFPIL